MEAWGTATPLADGSLVTARHVFKYFPTEINRQRIQSIDVLGRGATLASESGVRGVRGHVFAGDWVHFRARPYDADSGWVQIENRPRPVPGQTVVVRGYRASYECSQMPVIAEVYLKVRDAPSWVDASEKSLIFAEPAYRGRAEDTGGMSGGPVLLQCGDSGEVLVGIFLGRITEEFLFFRSQLYVIQPWPPADDE